MRGTREVILGYNYINSSTRLIFAKDGLILCLQPSAPDFLADLVIAVRIINFNYCDMFDDMIHTKYRRVSEMAVCCLLKYRVNAAH